MADLHPALSTPACTLFGVRYPIVQTAMGWVSDARLTAATAEAGGLGILASATLTLAEAERAILQVKDLTGAAFGVGLRGDAADLTERVRMLIRHGVRVASFGLAPREREVRMLKDAGVIVVPSIGAVRHAEKVASWGVDAVIVQGSEGGGHTGSIGTSVLLPQVTAAVDLPVIGAGGFHDGRGLVAALAYGAVGIAMGTRFLLTKESPVPESVKREYLSRGVDRTIITTALDGAPQRVLRTPLVDQLTTGNAVVRSARSARHAAAVKNASHSTWSHLIRDGLAVKKRRSAMPWSQLLTAAAVPTMLQSSMVYGRTDLGTLAAGQVTGVIDDVPSCAELLARIMAQADAVLQRLSAAAGSAAQPEAVR